MASLKQRHQWHPPAKDARSAVRRCMTLARRLRYKGNTYDADVAEFELLPFLIERETVQRRSEMGLK